MRRLFIVLVICLVASCSQKESNREMEVTPPIPASPELKLNLSNETLYNKVLGALVGSAIGDAMGAPTEMWGRSGIKTEYGLVDSLDNMVRAPSPEGTWAHNLPAGGTTDDTRWKLLFGQYLSTEAEPTAKTFSRYIVHQYKRELQGIKSIETFDPAPLADQMRRIEWLQEWALVADPFVSNDLTGYINRLSRFYGGEMTCAGLLYAPLLGVSHPDPMTAYEKAFELSIFDIGFAKDVTAINASLVAAAMRYESQDSIMSVLRDVDPQGFFESRLIGRRSYSLYKDALYIVKGAAGISGESEQVKSIYQSLDSKNQDLPFHAAEIHLISLVALMFSDFEFEKAMSFIVNYGRDNDTVAALTGLILGAYHGFDKLPVHLTAQVLEVNKNQLGIDLEKVARELTDQMISRGLASN